MSEGQTTIKPCSVLIAAMGGEGGGVLTDWLVQAARTQGLMVQSTSIPGVAQRTGATTYYVEVFPTPLAQLGGGRPILALAPSVGEVDLIASTELMEAARAVGRGFATPGRTRIIASTHRVYAVAEKTAQGDGRYDSAALLAAVAAGSEHRLLVDMEAMAKQAGGAINAVLLGAMAGSGVLPLPVESFEAAIREGGKAVEGNLAAFRAGLAAMQGGEREELPRSAPKRPAREVPSALALVARAHAELPEPARAMAEEGVRRLAAYQDLAYARLYLERLVPIWAAERDEGGDGALTRQVARHLAVRMAFDDVIRVAAAKSDPARFARIRAELGARPEQPVVVTEVLKPGVEEIAGLLPGGLARPLLALGHGGGGVSLRLTSTGILGLTLLRLTARLKGLRRFGSRFAQEQSAIEDWLDCVQAATRRSPELGLEVADCARLIKGYGETWRRGQTAFAAIRQRLVDPALNRRWPLAFAVDAIASARAAALSDPEGQALTRCLEQVEARAPA